MPHEVPSHFHAVVWLDHQEARIFHVTETEAERILLHPHQPSKHLHNHGARSHGHLKADDAFLHQVVEALSGAQEWLVTGPGSTKTELVKHIERHDPGLRDRVVGIESADHPTDGQIVAHARRYFAKYDRTVSNAPAA